MKRFSDLLSRFPAALALPMMLAAVLLMLAPPMPAFSQVGTRVQNGFTPCTGVNCDNVMTIGGTWKIGSTAVTASAAELNKIVGAVDTPTYSAQLTFTETAVTGTYTGTVIVPAGATITNIMINCVALWTNSGSASMKVGDTDDDGYFTAVDLKGTDCLAGESLSIWAAGTTEAGVYIHNTQVDGLYSATAHSITGIVTTGTGNETAGRTRLTVTYSLPVAADTTAATKA